MEFSVNHPFEFKRGAIHRHRKACVFLVSGVLWAFLHQSAAAEDEQQTILVRRVVPSNFHDPEFDAEQFEKLLKTSLPRSLPVTSGSLSNMLQENFKLSQSWTPAAYEATLKHVMNVNNIRDATKEVIKGKEYIFPDLPMTSQVNNNKNSPIPLQAKASSALEDEMNWDISLQALKGVPKISDYAATSKKELQYRKIPLSALNRLNLAKSNVTYEYLKNNYQYQVMQEHMKVTMADSLIGSTHASWILPAETEALSKFLARPAKTRPVLVVLDDSWPSQNDYQHAVEFVINASREIREKFGLKDKAHGDSKDLITLEKQYKQGTNFCGQNCEYPNLKLHSAMIRESLKEMIALDKANRVDIVYLPLNRTQLFANELLAEILRVALLADSLTDGLVLNTPGIVPPQTLVRGRPDFDGVEVQVVEILRPTYLSNALIPFDGRQIVVQTDKGIIDGIVNFLWLYSWASQRPHFLSMSWTSPNLKYSTLFRPNGYGLWLAATGNDPTINVQDATVQFAARSSDPGDFLAVENISAACPSSTLGTAPGLPILGFAFHGRISTDLCGTSFSTPRVAWILAAKEAIKGAPVVMYAPGWSQWRAKRRAELMAIQNQLLTGEDRYKVTPWQLLQEPQP